METGLNNPIAVQLFSAVLITGLITRRDDFVSSAPDPTTALTRIYCGGTCPQPARKRILPSATEGHCIVLKDGAPRERDLTAECNRRAEALFFTDASKRLTANYVCTNSQEDVVAVLSCTPTACKPNESETAALRGKHPAAILAYAKAPAP